MRGLGLAEIVVVDEVDDGFAGWMCEDKEVWILGVLLVVDARFLR